MRVGFFTVVISLALLALTPLSLAADSADLLRLREAVNAYRAGQFEQCAAFAGRLSARKLHNPDSALFIEAQCLFYARRYAAARERFRDLATKYPTSPHAILAAYRIADCDWELGDKNAALIHYQDAEKPQPSRTQPSRTQPSRTQTNPSDGRVDRAIGLIHQGQILLERGQEQDGLRLHDDVRLHFPSHPLTATLPDTQRESSVPVAEALSVVRAFMQAGRLDEALTVLNWMPQPTTDAERYETAFLTGRILFGMAGHKKQAQRLLFAARDKAPTPAQAEQAWFWGSRCFSRLGQDDQAIQSHRSMVARYPDGANAAAALYYAGWLEQNQDRCDKAWPIFEQVLLQYKRSSWAREARWYYAWCSLRNQRWEETLAILKPHRDHPSVRVVTRAIYWSAYAALSLGRDEEAHASWKSMAERYPLTWYALLARLQLGDKAPPPPAPPPPAQKTVLPDDPLLRKVNELIAAQLPAFAGFVLRQGEKNFLDRHPNHRGRQALMEAYHKAGDFHRAWRMAPDNAPALLSLPTAETRILWDHAYPPYLRELLTRYAGADAPFSLFLQAIMRTESGFDAHALSFANARGLMQLIPSTAARVSVAMGLDPDEQDLFDPEFNIRAASWYLGRLGTKFRGQWPLIAAAYNGGTPAVMKWCALFGQRSLDAFVESIPYAETREYVKSVVETFFRYAYLEGAPEPRLTVSVESRFPEDDLNY